VLFGLQLASREIYENWLAFGRDLIARDERARPRGRGAPGETSALSLIWAVLELSSHGWRGVVMMPKTVAKLECIRRQQTNTPSNTQEVIAA
jgi:hypothetical protein